MESLKKAAVITKLIDQLREKGSWCGETHIQKTVFFLQEMMEVPLGFDFILYKHGPFSFDLRDELTSYRADGLVILEPQWPYGPRIATTESSETIQANCSKTLAGYNKQIDFIAEKFADKKVLDLERLATAFYVSQRSQEHESVAEKAKQIVELKPHISRESAEAAILEIDTFLHDARK